MPELTREEKLKMIENLTPRLRDFLYSEDTGAFLLYIGKKYNLPDEKVSALSKIVADIVLKITPIINLAQEIVNKITPDHQIAMAIAQELNNELLAPVLMPKPAAPLTTAAPTVPVSPAPMPAAPAPAPISPPAQIPSSDKYREPTTGPEVVDLRKSPPPQIPGPVSTAPIPPAVNKIEPLPVNLRDFSASSAPAPLPRSAAKPLTFTKPIEKTPLIEAEPHLSGKISPEISAGETPHAVPPAPEPKPQFIIRPPGLSPTDLPRGVLDLRKDRGEF